MAAPTLVIGVGGTGVRVLLRVKERFLEAYDKVPDEVILFELDTDSYDPDQGTFNGVSLLVTGQRIPWGTVGPGQAEFYHVATRDLSTRLDTIYDKKNKGDPAWQWINEDRLKRTLTKPGEQVISVGANTVRPVGRSALYLDYENVYQKLKARLDRILHLYERNVEGVQDKKERKKRKAAVFVVASMAGGSGAGMVIDILRMLQHMRNQENRQAEAFSVIPLLVGGGVFTTQPGERTSSNTFACSRELDRLGAVAGRSLNKEVPPVVWAPAPVGRFSSIWEPADRIFLFDRPDRLGREHLEGIDATLPNPYLNMVIAPALADLIVTFADERVAPDLNSVLADVPTTLQNQDPLKKSIRGYYPYLSAGLHTLIFPERDVRRSAGLRLLLELWDDYLVRAEKLEKDTPDGSDLERATTELWASTDPPPEEGLMPYVFTDAAFQTETVCKNVGNNNFVRWVVTSALNKKVQWPAGGGLFGRWFRKSTVHRTLAMIGIPGSGSTTDAKKKEEEEERKQWASLERTANRLERSIDHSIEALDNCQHDQEVREWRRMQLGGGPLGNETGGKWIEDMKKAEIVTGHRQDFAAVLRRVVMAILNDAEAEKQLKLPHRLEYARRVLDRLEQHILRLIQGDPRDLDRMSLLAEEFARQMQEEERRRAEVNRWAAQAARGEQFGKYLKANKRYAKAKKELVGKRLLELLCEDLLEEVRALQGELDKWRKYLRAVRRELTEEQTRHEQNRLEKAQIPVRTYLSDRPRDGYFKDGELEKGLYDKHKGPAIDSFLQAIKWQGIGGNVDLQVPFGMEPPKELSVDEIKERAIRWACTKEGNADRPDAMPPLRELGSPSEVNMAVRIRDHFGREGMQLLASTLTSERLLASLCPLRGWPGERSLYALALPVTAGTETDVGPFYQEVKKAITEVINPPRFHKRQTRVDDPENSRHAVAAEFAVGFKLHHRRDYEAYEEAYREDIDRFQALHCLPEEDRASTHFEQEFRRKSELYKRLGLAPKVLDPAVVDVLGNQERLELFVKALAVGAIGLLPKKQRLVEGADLYLRPKADPSQRLRLSKMNTNAEIQTIAMDLTTRSEQLSEITGDPKIVNRLRMMYALRTFVLKERDVGDQTHTIAYGDVERSVDKIMSSATIDRRVQIYEAWTGKFLQYHKDHHNTYPMLADLGLVLARVAHDLKNTEKSKGR